MAQNTSCYFPIFIRNLATIIAINAAEMVATQTGSIIDVGLSEFKELLIAITVVGIS